MSWKSFTGCFLLYCCMLAIVGGCGVKYKGLPITPGMVCIDLQEPLICDIPPDMDIDCQKIQDLLYPVFTDCNFIIASRNPSRGYFRTDWLILDGKSKNPFIKQKEKRKYEIHIDPDRLIKNRFYLSINVQIEECAPVGSRCREKNIDLSMDEQYKMILENIRKLLCEKG